MLIVEREVVRMKKWEVCNRWLEKELGKKVYEGTLGVEEVMKRVAEDLREFLGFRPELDYLELPNTSLIVIPRYYKRFPDGSSRLVYAGQPEFDYQEWEKEEGGRWFTSWEPVLMEVTT